MSYDLLVMRTPHLSGTGTVTLNLFDEPALVRGMQLLAQRFMTLLLRDYDERFERGTTLLAEVHGGRVINEPYLMTRVSLAIAIVRQQLPTDGPDDETLDSAIVTSVVKTNDGAKVQISLTSVAGETAVIELPRVL